VGGVGEKGGRIIKEGVGLERSPPQEVSEL